MILPVVALGAIVRRCLMVTLSADDDLSVEERKRSSAHFRRAKNIDIDNVRRLDHVTGTDAREIKVEIHKTIRARSTEKVQEAKREVRWIWRSTVTSCGSTWTGRFAATAATAPFNYRGSHHYGYEVSFDFTVKVPRDTNVRLRTVNHGDIRVENTSGTFDVDNVNGGVELLEVAGSGHAYALNRPLKVTFSRNPPARAISARSTARWRWRFGRIFRLTSG